jgi:hypothetical protein
MLAITDAFRRLGGDWWMPAPTPRLVWATLGEVAGVSPPGGAGMTTGATTVLAVIVGSCAAIFIAARRSREWVAPLAGAATYVSCLLGISLAGIHVWWPRTLIPAAVPFIVATAWAMVASGRPVRRVAFVAVGASATLLGVWWIASEARRPLEPWRAAVAVLDDENVRMAWAVPDYAAFPLRRASTAALAHIVPVKVGSAPDQAMAGPAVATQWRDCGSAAFVIRVDLTSQRAFETIERLVTARASHIDAAGVSSIEAVLILAPDASLVPSLRATRDAFERQLQAIFGTPLQRELVGESVFLRFRSVRGEHGR